MYTLRILHTNDLHSHFENWPKIKRLLAQKQIRRDEEAVLTLDLGDFLDRWHPLTEATDGQVNISLMNEIGYDAVTIGNNEGIGNSHDVLEHLYDQANFPVTVANLYDQKTNQRPHWAQPYLILDTTIGIKVGVIGLTAPFPLTYTPNGWTVTDPLESLETLLPEVKHQVDYLIVLSHLGIQTDDEIARRFPDVDLILGSHTHHLFEKGKKIGDTQLAAAGKFGYYVGEVMIEFDEQRIKRASQAKTFLIESQSSLPEDDMQITQWVDEGISLLKQEHVARLPFALTLAPHDKHSLLSYALKSVAQRGQTTISVLNTGLFLDGLDSGIVTKADLHKILPHPMRLIRVGLTGQDLVRLIGEIEKNRLFLKHYPIKGMGFRGKIFGEVLYHGLVYDPITHNVSIEGKPVEKEAYYELTTVDHLMFIPFFPTIELAGNVTFLFPEFLRTVVAEGLSRYFPIKKSQRGD